MFLATPVLGSVTTVHTSMIDLFMCHPQRHIHAPTHSIIWHSCGVM
jgi:hypothetical protein